MSPSLIFQACCPPLSRPLSFSPSAPAHHYLHHHQRSPLVHHHHPIFFIFLSRINIITIISSLLLVKHLMHSFIFLSRLENHHHHLHQHQLISINFFLSSSVRTIINITINSFPSLSIEEATYTINFISAHHHHFFLFLVENHHHLLLSFLLARSLLHLFNSVSSFSYGQLLLHALFGSVLLINILPSSSGCWSYCIYYYCFFFPSPCC